MRLTKQFGPPQVFWMCPFERFNFWIISRVKNRRYPESTVIETYRLFELANFLQRSGELPNTAVTLTHDDMQLAFCQTESNHNIVFSMGN